MAEPFLGEIRIFPFNFTPNGWAPCNGQILPVQQNQALFSLLGSTYGGNGQTTFALPDLRGRALMQQGTGPDGIAYARGDLGGAETVTLAANMVPPHLHIWGASGAVATTLNPTGNYPATPVARPQPPNPPTPPPPYNITYNLYAPASANQVTLAASTLGTGGAGAPHNNIQPFLVLGYFMAITGYYPPRPW